MDRLAKAGDKKFEETNPDIIVFSDNDSARTENKIEQKRTEIALVVNPTSSGGSTGKDWERQFAKIKEAFDKEPKLVFTEKSGDGTTLTKDLLNKGYQNIVAIGGDGTINEVANGFFLEESNTDISNDASRNAQKRQNNI
jgi:predicted polyphosphate/ATP-dependent NAD kinase